MGREHKDIHKQSAVKALENLGSTNSLATNALFKDTFIEKVGALAGDESDGDSTRGGDQNFNAYLYHLSKLKGVNRYSTGTIPTDVLVDEFCNKVLSKLDKKSAVESENQDGTHNQGAAMASVDDGNKSEEELKQEIAAQIDAAFRAEFTELGAVQSIKKYYPNTQMKFASKWEFFLYVVEHFILGGRTLSTDVPDNFVMTPTGRFSKFLYYVSPVNTALSTVTGAAFNVINYIFFGAMIFYVLQLPLLYLFRRLVKQDKDAKVSLAETLFYLAGCAIFGLVGAATFVALFWPFVIGVFSLAFVAHSANLILTIVGRSTARQDYENSLNRIAKLRRGISKLRKQRQDLYALLDKERIEATRDPNRSNELEIDLLKQIESLNGDIAKKTGKLDKQIEAHDGIRKKHEIAYNNSKLKFAVTAVILSALVLTFFILSTPACPPMFIPALVVLVILGVIGAGLVIAKTRNQYRNDEKSKREHAIELDIAEDLPLADKLQHENSHHLSAVTESKEKHDLASEDDQLVQSSNATEADEKAPLIANNSSTTAATKKLRVISGKFDADDLSMLKENKKFSESKTVKSLSENSVGLFSGKSKEGYIEKSYNSDGKRIRLYGSREILKDKNDRIEKSRLDEAIEMNKPLYTKPSIAVGSK